MIQSKNRQLSAVRKATMHRRSTLSGALLPCLLKLMDRHQPLAVSIHKFRSCSATSMTLLAHASFSTATDQFVRETRNDAYLHILCMACECNNVSVDVRSMLFPCGKYNKFPPSKAPSSSSSFVYCAVNKWFSDRYNWTWQ